MNISPIILRGCCWIVFLACFGRYTFAPVDQSATCIVRFYLFREEERDLLASTECRHHIYIFERVGEKFCTSICENRTYRICVCIVYVFTFCHFLRYRHLGTRSFAALFMYHLLFRLLPSILFNLRLWSMNSWQKPGEVPSSLLRTCMASIRGITTIIIVALNILYIWWEGRGCRLISLGDNRERTSIILRDTGLQRDHTPNAVSSPLP